MRYSVLAFVQLVAATNIMPGVKPRQDSVASCTSAAYALVTNGVEPSGDLDAALVVFQSTAVPADYCNPGTALPSSLQSTWAAYKSGVQSYYKAHASEIASVESSCPQADYVTSLAWLGSIFDGSFCTPSHNATAAAGTGSVMATATPTSSVTPVTAGAAQNQGLMGAAVLVAGLLGTVAAL